MALTDDASTLQTALESLAGISYSPAQMVILIDAALIESINYRGDVNSYNLGGRNISTDRRTLMELRRYYHELARDADAGGPIVTGQAEFVADLGYDE